MSMSITVQGAQELQRIERHIAQLADTGHQDRLKQLIGAEVESQTHRRIQHEKNAPDGTPWAPWSSTYSKTRHGNQSLLMGSGDLDDSIEFFVSGDKVHVGSPLVYARAHQNGFEGAVDVPAHTRLITQAFGKVLKFPVYQNVKPHQRSALTPQRAFLGLSSANERELLALIGDFWQDII
ncbi:phage virion morphogenesis protein [Moritella viscosa]|uniref:Prophage MuSo2, virion morphogenesis protein, putative n=1 Tax=Moritella viscosa TaxID=80854 RepID=A0ABY1HCG0_9GAMM|nr:phage virion morphogenesis protein [Moritella viscosa]CED61140.1 bacteriophage Mu-like gp31 protein [Moritella viscosa]SGY85089.1 Prophage MuSo2, virion morphogenesis protein, putative [Moritella viscosa]SGY87275.1 Prophage MuSo2, virion morphogenesis protein, putative [Moritella viscosa]SHN99434.1 Prophage MuSo2, virion morphogenesis protein, putative [Moritella viscosa]SHO20107.1 Prophage MuSo2, virion morphogenesis protein, putative [Moritella viscosa]